MAIEQHRVQTTITVPPAGPRSGAPRRPIALGLGAAAAAGALLLYALDGYSIAMLLLWLAGLLVVGAGIWRRSPALPRIARGDLGIAGLLALGFAPLYLLGLHAWPVQVNSDEVVIMAIADRYASVANLDPFGLAGDYFGFPTALFALFGEIGELFGGVGLTSMRFVHALTGLTAVVVSYALFRQLLSRGWAVVAVCILGSAHALVMLSRMALRDNVSVLIEVAALALLIAGLRRGNWFMTYCGGLVAGLGFYLYFPGRAIFVVWLAALAVLVVAFRRSFPRSLLIRHGAIATAACLLVASPVLIATAKAPSELTDHQREALLIFPESRQQQQEWVFADSEAEGVRKNIENGLTTFNNEVEDHAFIYPNPGHGFVDPLTGVLLWIGVAVTLVGLRRRGDALTVIPLCGFVALWLGFALLVNKAPNYPRMLIVLPFVAYLATVGIRAAARALGTRLGRRGGSLAVPALAACAVAAVGVWNLAIAWDFVDRGRARGDDIGSSGRYMESQRDRPGQTFHVVANRAYPFYEWGFPGHYRERLVMFADESQVGEIVAPVQLRNFQERPPFSLLMRSVVWELFGDLLRDRYPGARSRELTPGGELVAVEVLGDRG